MKADDLSDDEVEDEEKLEEISCADANENISESAQEYPLEYLRNFDASYTSISEVIDSGVIPNILKLLQSSQCTFHIFMHGYLREMEFNFAFPNQITKLIDTFSDIFCVNQGFLILAHVTAGTNDQTQHIVDIGAMPILIDGIKPNMTTRIKAKSFEALANIIVHDTKYKDFVLSHDILKYMKLAVCIDDDQDIAKDEQNELFLLSKQILFCLTDIFTDRNIDHKWIILILDILQAFWAIRNLFTFGHETIIEYLIKLGAINKLLLFFISVKQTEQNAEILGAALGVISLLKRNPKYFSIEHCNLEKKKEETQDLLTFVMKD